ncbi:MAG: hypothetical protein ACKODY_04880, partial [Actinomycetota bacterium]
MPVLTPDMVRSTGASWTEVRRAAAERAAVAPFPTTDAEHWRYSRIDELSLADFTPAATPSTISGPTECVARVDADGAAAPANLGSLFGDWADASALELFAALNLANMDVIVVSVPANTVVAEPIVITHDFTDSARAYFPRVVVDAGVNSEVTVVERFVSGDARILVVPALDVRTASAARVRYLSINELGTSSWLIGDQQSSGDRDSDTLLATVA